MEVDKQAQLTRLEIQDFARKKKAGGILVTFGRGGNAKLPEAAGSVECLDGEQAAAAVAEDEEPPTGGAARVLELRPAAVEEGAVVVAPDLDAPQDIAIPASGADDEGLPAPVPGADLIGELVRDVLRMGGRIKDESFPRQAKESAVFLLTNLSRLIRTSTLRSLPAAPPSADGAMSGQSREGKVGPAAACGPGVHCPLNEEERLLFFPERERAR
jgi:hypothetical protein